MFKQEIFSLSVRGIYLGGDDGGGHSYISHISLYLLVSLLGRNFGCGSSREQPALGLQAVKIQAVVGKSFARIFYRAAINQGLILIECPDAVDAYQEGSSVKLDLENGQVEIDGKSFTFPRLPADILAIRDAGMVINDV